MSITGERSRFQNVTAALIACSGGAQVLAGVSGGLTPWQSAWLATTMAAAFSAAILGTGPSEKPRSLTCNDMLRNKKALG